MKRTKEEKLVLVSNKQLIVGIDAAKRRHCACGINQRGYEVIRPFIFSNDVHGFEKLITLIRREVDDLNKVVIGFEPTGHYWKVLANYAKERNMTVVIVNPYHVHQTREIEDNSPNKVDPKDAILVANLISRGKFSFVRFPTGKYAEARHLDRIWEKLKKRLWRVLCCIYSLIDQYFPEYYGIFKGVLGKTSMGFLEDIFLPSELLKLKEAAVRKKLKRASNNRLRRGKVEKLYEVARESVGLKEGSEVAKFEMKLLMEEVKDILDKMGSVRNRIVSCLSEIEEAKYILSIDGIGPIVTCAFLGRIGGVDNFTYANQVVKFAGLNLVENSSGERKGRKKISKRGDKRLRAIAYQGALTCIAKNPSFRAYYRDLLDAGNEKMESVTAVATKLLRTMFALGKRKEYWDKDRWGRAWRKPPLGLRHSIRQQLSVGPCI